MGVRIKAVASLEKNAVRIAPRAKIVDRRVLPLPPDIFTALKAHHSKNPAWSAITLMIIKPRKKSRMLELACHTSQVWEAETTRNMSITTAPVAAAVASLKGLGRSMTRTIVNMKIVTARNKFSDSFFPSRQRKAG